MSPVPDPMISALQLWLAIEIARGATLEAFGVVFCMVALVFWMIGFILHADEVASKRRLASTTEDRSWWYISGTP